MRATEMKWVQMGRVGRAGVLLAIAAGLYLSGETGAVAALKKAAAADATASAGAAPQPDDAKDKQSRIVIQRIESDDEGAAKSSKEVAWLGVGTDEAGEALAAQLGLKAGEGLVVTYIAPDSPAAKAGLQKNDVLVEFDNQLMVHPEQLRKLVQMHKSGDALSLELFRGGQKQTVQVTLGKTHSSRTMLADERAWHGDMSELHRQLQELNGRNREALEKEMKALHESLAKAGLDREAVRAQVRHGIEEARRAAEAALRHATNQLGGASANLKVLQELARSGVDMDKDSTVIIKRHDQSVQTQVKTDDTGTYVIVANPKKRLTAHDPDGKLLFDGEIETPEQQEKVPKEVWTKVEPMLKQMSKAEAEDEK